MARGRGATGFWLKPRSGGMELSRARMSPISWSCRSRIRLWSMKHPSWLVDGRISKISEWIQTFCDQTSILAGIVLCGLARRAMRVTSLWAKAASEPKF